MNSDPLSESSPVTSNGIVSTAVFSALRMWMWALLRIERVTTHPVRMSVRFTVRELASHRRPAVRDGVAVEEPRSVLGLVAVLIASSSGRTSTE